MSEYTEEDFKNARFADHARGGTAASTGDLMDTHPWALGNETYLSHADMAARGWRPVREAAPATLDTLREAWEDAESLEACRSTLSEGDVLIIKEPHDIYLVRPAYEEVLVGRADAENVRVLYRSPQPWQALADVLDDSPPWVECWRAGEAARWLHERGVRVTGGDEA